MHNHTTVAAAVALAFAAAPLAAWAQQASPERKPDEEKKHLETISVTAEKVTGFKARTSQVGAFRDAEILDVPLTINVIPRTVLDVQQVEGIFDALKNTAGVTRAQTSGIIADNLVIRGITVENRTSYRLNGGLRSTTFSRCRWRTRSASRSSRGPPRSTTALRRPPAS
jgi:iron complex outermembrane receptor protein